MTSDQINYWKNQEVKRANQALESIRRSELLETRRANQARESETIRANQAHEQEAHRSNLAREREQEQQRLYNYGIANRQSIIAQRDYENRFRNTQLQEIANNRSYSNTITSLAESQRANLAREKENIRSNVANENISRLDKSIDQGRLNETRRSNLRQEQLQERSQNFQLVGNLASSAIRKLSVPNLNTFLSNISKGGH